MATRLRATCVTVLVSCEAGACNRLQKPQADENCVAKCYSDKLGQLWTLHCTLRLHYLINDTSTSHEEICALHEAGQNLLECLQHRMLSLEVPRPHSDEQSRCHADLCRTFCFVSALVILLAAFRGPQVALCAQQNTQRADVVASLVFVAQRAQIYRPLGSLSATWALAIAWASCPIDAEKKTIEGLIFEQDVACIKLRAQQMMQQADSLFRRLSSSLLIA